MDREWMQQGDTGSEQGSDEIAGRLDRLRADQAEDVLRRAIELSDEEAPVIDDGRFDQATLERVAAELGIPARHVRRAIAEQRLELTDPDENATLLDRIYGITDFDEAAIIRGDGAAVRTAIETWLGSHEGLRVRRTTPDGAVWSKDERPAAAIKMGLGMTHGSKTLRSLDAVEHSIRGIDESEHLVSVTASKQRVRLSARLATLGAALVTAIVMGAAAGAESLAVALALGGGVAAASLSIAVASIRSWTRKIRDAVDQAVAAIADPERSGVFDTLPGRIGGWLKSIGLGDGRSSRGGGRHIR